MPDRRGTLASFGNITFRTLWITTQISNLGGMVQIVGAGWLMTIIADSHDMVALVQASSTLPIMIFSIAAGALADNVDRRKLLIFAQCFMFAASVLLAATAVLGLLSAWLLLAFTFLIGCGKAVHNPSWQASVGDIVSREDLRSAVALNSAGFNLTRALGPAFGGALVAAAGAAVAFALNAVSYIFLIVALARWKRPQDASAQTELPPEGIFRAMGTGIRYAAASPNLLLVSIRAFMFGSGAISILALLPVVTREMVSGDAFLYGILLGCFGAGAIAGAFINARIGGQFTGEWVIRAAFAGSALSTMIIAMSRDALLSGVLLVVSGACWVLALTLLNVTVQLSTPRWVVGRAIALYQTALFGGMTAGSWLWGVVSGTYGPESALLIASLALVAGALAGLFLALPDPPKQDLHPLNRAEDPVMALGIPAQSGPISVTIRYEIAPGDVLAFLAAMAERKTIRLRNGARRWTLLHDLEDPSLWMESYHFPTWLDYMRHNRRRTRADSAVTEKLRSLHRGTGRPLIQRTIEHHASSQDTGGGAAV